MEEGGPEMATPKRVRTYRPKHSDTSLSREWRMNMVNKKKKKEGKPRFNAIAYHSHPQAKTAQHQTIATNNII